MAIGDKIYQIGKTGRSGNQVQEWVENKSWSKYNRVLRNGILYRAEGDIPSSAVFSETTEFDTVGWRVFGSPKVLKLDGSSSSDIVGTFVPDPDAVSTRVQLQACGGGNRPLAVGLTRLSVGSGGGGGGFVELFYTQPIMENIPYTIAKADINRTPDHSYWGTDTEVRAGGYGLVSTTSSFTNLSTSNRMVTNRPLGGRVLTTSPWFVLRIDGEAGTVGELEHNLDGDGKLNVRQGIGGASYWSSSTPSNLQVNRVITSTNTNSDGVFPSVGAYGQGHGGTMSAGSTTVIDSERGGLGRLIITEYFS